MAVQFLCLNVQVWEVTHLRGGRASIVPLISHDSMFRHDWLQESASAGILDVCEETCVWTSHNSSRFPPCSCVPTMHAVEW